MGDSRKGAVQELSDHLVVSRNKRYPTEPDEIASGKWRDLCVKEF